MNSLKLVCAYYYLFDKISFVNFRLFGNFVTFTRKKNTHSCKKLTTNNFNFYGICFSALVPRITISCVAKTTKMQVNIKLTIIVVE